MRRDHLIEHNTLEEIDFDPKVEAAEIGVIVQNGAVILHGTVQSYFEKDAPHTSLEDVKRKIANAPGVTVNGMK